MQKRTHCITIRYTDDELAAINEIVEAENAKIQSILPGVRLTVSDITRNLFQKMRQAQGLHRATSSDERRSA